MIQSSVVTTKGQIVLPAMLRKKLGIKQGTKVFFEIKGTDIVVHPSTSGFYERTFGLLKGGGLVKRLEQLRSKDARREKAKFERH